MNICSDAMDFYAKFANIFIDAWIDFTRTIFEYKNWYASQELEKEWLSKSREIFASKLKDENFVASLSTAVECYSKLARTTAMGQFYQNISNLTSFWNNFFIEPIRDTLCRTPDRTFACEECVGVFFQNFIRTRGT